MRLPWDPRGLRAERDTNSELPRLLDHGRTERAIEPDGGQEQRQQAEGAERFSTQPPGAVLRIDEVGERLDGSTTNDMTAETNVPYSSLVSSPLAIPWRIWVGVTLVVSR